MHPSQPFSHLRLATPSPLDGLISMPVDVRVYRAGDWSVVEIAGELDIQGVSVVPQLLTGEGALVVFDLHRTTFMDCSGLGLLAVTARAASQRGGSVRIAGASRQVRKLVTLAHLDRAVSIFESLEDALTSPTGSGPEAAAQSPRG
jgi:anti-anti-sigma factor